MFFDKQRQFWPIYQTWKRSKNFNIVNVVLRNCSQINLFEAAMKGGNILPVVKTGFRKSVHFDIQHVFRIAPCIITNSKYLTPQLDFISENKYSVQQDIELYSHPFLLQYFLFPSNISYNYSSQCSENKAELSGYHILAAKGFWSLYEKSINKESLKCKNRYLITPTELAYFFNHSLPYQEYIDIKQFRKNHFRALFSKIVMDFRTFVFPKHSKAWRCFQYVHRFNRMSQKKLVCLDSLENEICSLLSELYLDDWRVVFKMFTLMKIPKYGVRTSKHPFDFISYFQHVRTTCKFKRNKYSFPHVAKYFKTSNTIHNKCLILADSLKSRICLKYVSSLNKQRKYVNYKIQSILVVYFPFCYLIYHRFIRELPDLAQHNTIEIIQMINAYGSFPFFHNNKRYDYWNELNSPFANPFRTMTRSILTSDLPEILSWIRFSKKKIKKEDLQSEMGKQTFLSNNYPLSVYANFNINLFK